MFSRIGVLAALALWMERPSNGARSPLSAAAGEAIGAVAGADDTGATAAPCGGILGLIATLPAGLPASELPPGVNRRLRAIFGLTLFGPVYDGVGAIPVLASGAGGAPDMPTLGYDDPSPVSIGPPKRVLDAMAGLGRNGSGATGVSGANASRAAFAHLPTIGMLPTTDLVSPSAFSGDSVRNFDASDDPAPVRPPATNPAVVFAQSGNPRYSPSFEAP